MSGDDVQATDVVRDGSRLTVHTWGFVNDAGEWIAGDGAAISTETVQGAWERLNRHHRHFGREPEKCRTTRTLDGWLVGIEFEAPDDGTAARMWHRLHPERDAWPDFTLAATEEADRD